MTNSTELNPIFNRISLTFLYDSGLDLYILLCYNAYANEEIRGGEYVSKTRPGARDPKMAG